jgi:hypothetical protein
MVVNCQVAADKEHSCVVITRLLVIGIGDGCKVTRSHS